MQKKKKVGNFPLRLQRYSQEGGTQAQNQKKHGHNSCFAAYQVFGLW